MLVSDELALKLPISIHCNQRTLNYFFSLVSLERWRGLTRGNPRWPIWVTHTSDSDTRIWPHLLAASFLSRAVTLRHPNAHRHLGTSCTEMESPQPPAPAWDSPHVGAMTWYIWTHFPAELNPLIRPERSQIIITNNMAVITAIIILVVLLLVPSYHFHLIIMLFMIWPLFK